MVGSVMLSPPTSGDRRGPRDSMARDMPALVVTCRGLEGGRRTRSALRRALPAAFVARTPFRGVLRVEADGDRCALAAHVTSACKGSVGRVTAIVEETPSTAESLRAAAGRVAAGQIVQGESFAFRVHKRGAHGYAQSTPQLEREVGAAIWAALERRDSVAPSVDLVQPDVLVNAEVLGPTTFVGVLRRAWLCGEQAGDAVNADVAASTEGG